MSTINLNIARILFSKGAAEKLMPILEVLADTDATAKIAKIKAYLLDLDQGDGRYVEPIVLATLESLAREDMTPFFTELREATMPRSPRRHMCMKLSAGLAGINYLGNELSASFARLIEYGERISLIELAAYWGMTADEVREWLSKNIARCLDVDSYARGNDRIPSIVKELRIGITADHVLKLFICEAAHKCLARLTDKDKIRFISDYPALVHRGQA